MRRKLAAVFALVSVIASLAIPSSASAYIWKDYFGPSGTMTQEPGNDYIYGTWNNWLNNRVYRPKGHIFVLGYWHTDGTYVLSTQNSSDNPFYFPGPYGYTQPSCGWNHYNDSTYALYPVTCESYRAGS
jgi:hypothetical protein